MRARIATTVVLLSTIGLSTIGLLASPVGAEECHLVEEVLNRGCEAPPPPPPEPQPESQPQPPPEPQPEPASPPGHRPAAVSRLLDLMNGERRQAGLPLFSLRADVSAVSGPHSEAMAAKGTIWHNDGYFTTATRRRLGARLLGENVARNPDIDDAHRRLMNSPGHRANVLDRRFTVVGLAVYHDGRGNLYVTQNFVQPDRGPAPASATVGRPGPAGAPSPSGPPTTASPMPPPAPEPAPAVVLAETSEPEMLDVTPARATRPEDGDRPTAAVLAGMLAVLLAAAAVVRVHRTGRLGPLQVPISIFFLHLPIWAPSSRRIDR